QRSATRHQQGPDDGRIHTAALDAVVARDVGREELPRDDPGALVDDEVQDQREDGEGRQRRRAHDHRRHAVGDPAPSRWTGLEQIAGDHVPPRRRLSVWATTPRAATLTTIVMA